MALILWATARQRGAARKLVLRHPLLGAVAEASLLLATGLAVAMLFLIVTNSWLSDSLKEPAKTLSGVMVYIAFAAALARLLEGWLNRFSGHRSHSRLSRTFFYGTFIALSVILYAVANDYTTEEFYLWTGGTAAILAFIMQQTLGDLFSGLALSLERPFRIGHWLRLKDGTEGQVEDINWRATHLRGWDNTTLVIPNSVLARENFTNLNGPQHMFAPWYTVQVSGEEDPDKVTALLKKAAEHCTKIQKEPGPVVRLMDAQSSPYTYMVKVQFPNYPAMFAGRDELYREIDKALRKSGIFVSADIQEIRSRKSTPKPTAEYSAPGNTES